MSRDASPTGTPDGRSGASPSCSRAPQGEDATLTDDKGEYHFTSLPVGTYVIRFYVANAAAQVEQGGVMVSADKMVRVNAKIAGATQAAAQEKYVIAGRPPVVDIGSARVGAQFDSEFTQNIPLNRTYGDVIERAPGAFVDPSGNVSIGGATGLENIYIVNGVNVTGIEYGNLEAGTPSIGGVATCRSSSCSRSTSAPAATRPTWAAAWAASSTASSSRAPTSSTAACSRTGRPTGCRRIRRRARPSDVRSATSACPTTTAASAPRSAARSSRTGCSSGPASRRASRTRTCSGRPTCSSTIRRR